jgi:hypothetical protein
MESSRDADVDLTQEQRRRIEQVHAGLPELSHYELLGVARDAPQKEIAHAYLHRTLEFQSTRFFGRSLGRYRAMMDAVFQQVNVAYQALRVPSRRADYDAGARKARLTSVDDMIHAELESMHAAHEDGRRERVAVPAAMPRIGDEPPRTKSGVQRIGVNVPAPGPRRAAG